MGFHSSMTKPFNLLTGLIFLLGCTSCSLLPSSTETALPNPTTVYATISAQLTATSDFNANTATLTVATFTPPAIASQLPSQAASLSPSRTSADRATAALTPTPSPLPCNLAAPGRPSVDVTIPDGAHMQAGQSFSKTWRLVNAGTCAWTADYAIIWFSGENFSAVREQAFSSIIRTGQSVDITVDMVAPRLGGAHQSNWKLRDARGALFGIGPNGDAPFWVRIDVEEIATPTALPQPSVTLTATPGNVAKGTTTLEVAKPFDLDSARINSGVGDDIGLQKLTATTFQLSPLNGARLADVGVLTPTDLDCRSSALTETPAASNRLIEGATFCYRTTQGLPGYLRIRLLALKENKITIDYLTWAIP
jgi:hypothetical protein